MEQDFSYNNNYKFVLDALSRSSNIAIVVHLNPDADALGSALALSEFLYGKGKEAIVYIHGLLPDNLRFLPGSEQIVPFNESVTDRFVASDLIIALDLNETRRLGSVESAFNKSTATKILIDHHLYPSHMADVIISETGATSTGELVFRLLDTANATISPNMATNLYAAIMSDTGGFRYDKTSSYTFRIAAKLADAGADPVRVYDEIYNTMSASAVRLLGLTLANMELYCNNSVVVMKISQEDFSRTGANELDIENFSDRLLMVSGVQMGVLISEIVERNEIRISFRSKNGVYIRELAAEFGGGGHKQASGARVTNGKFDSVSQIITARSVEYFQSQTQI